MRFQSIRKKAYSQFSVRRWIWLLVGVHIFATIYWCFPPSLKALPVDSDFAYLVENYLSPVFKLRQQLQSTAVGKLCRLYIGVFSLEQRWWLVSPNPPHAAAEVNVMIKNTNAITEIKWLRNFNADDGSERHPRLRELTLGRRMIGTDSKILLKAFAEQALANYRSSFPESRVSWIRVVAVYRDFASPRDLLTSLRGANHPVEWSVHPREVELYRLNLE